MKIIADLHIHSPYARAVSPAMTLENLSRAAAKKGITVMGTGDFTHPKWLAAIKAALEPAEEGLFRLRGAKASPVRFLLSVEVSSIYSRGGRGRRVHNLIFVPSFAAADAIVKKLGWLGNIASDGRPILGLDAEELLKITLDADSDAALVPAHAWTPWFSVFGSMSGFDSLEECFGDLAPHIFAIETGLSSDPEMNWRVGALDRVALISNSDAHSLSKIGREANVFSCDLSYRAIMDAIRGKDPARFLFTVEFFPEEGKYHYDGHSSHGVRLSPADRARLLGKCPTCGQKVTVGVLSRVEALADRPEGYRPPGAIPYRRMVPLDEIIGEAFGIGVSSKKVRAEYDRVIAALGTEFSALLDASPSDLASAAAPAVAEGIKRVREGKLEIAPGYDGAYGTVRIFDDRERKDMKGGQAAFFG